MSFEAESPKAAAVRLLAELDMSRGERAGKIALIAQAFRVWEARGLEDLAAGMEGVPACAHLRDLLLVRVKELRGKAIDIS